jgi:peroxiredoxin family protein
MSGRVVFFIQNGGYEPAFSATSLGLTAVAMGDEVHFVLAFDALRQLARGTFGLPEREREISESARGKGLGAPPPNQMLDEARAMGARVVACDTMVKLCGLGVEDLGKKLDEVMGLATLWRLTEDARILVF